MTADEIGDELARLHQRSFGWALACCDRDREEALDVLQTAYEKILSGRARYGERSSFVTWAFAVIKKTAASRRRSRKLRSFVSLAPVAGRPEPSTRAVQLEAAVRHDESRRLVVALNGLPPRQKDVLHLVFYQDMSIADSARVLGVQVGTARTHYERGKAALRKVLREPNWRSGT